MSPGQSPKSELILNQVQGINFNHVSQNFKAYLKTLLIWIRSIKVSASVEICKLSNYVQHFNVKRTNKKN